jgi:hypothetical protein
MKIIILAFLAIASFSVRAGVIRLEQNKQGDLFIEFESKESFQKLKQNGTPSEPQVGAVLPLLVESRKSFANEHIKCEKILRVVLGLPLTLHKCKILVNKTGEIQPLITAKKMDQLDLQLEASSELSFSLDLSVKPESLSRKEWHRLQDTFSHANSTLTCKKTKSFECEIDLTNAF